MTVHFDYGFLPEYALSVPAFLTVVCLICLGPILALAILEVSKCRTKNLQPKGCRRLGLQGHSHLADEFDAKYKQTYPPGKDGDGKHRWTVKSLWIYPVKSCRGVELNQGDVVSTGMAYDRQFSFAHLKPVSKNSDLSASGGHEERQKWEFLTQRRLPLLARVRTEVWIPDINSPSYSSSLAEVRSGGVIIVRFPRPSSRNVLDRVCSAILGGAEIAFQIPMKPTPDQIKQNGYTMEQMTIWKDSPIALNMGMHIPKELSQFLGIRSKISLFRVVDTHEREVYRCAPRKELVGYQPVTGFADAYPLHIMNLASVREVESKLPIDAPRISAIRFRPNIIVAGPEAYLEDTWKRIRIGEGIYYVACRTARCKLPNTDPLTGIRHPVEPDKTLRRHREVDEGAKGLACLGMQMVPASEWSKIRVGDPIVVMETGDHCYIRQ